MTLIDWFILAFTLLMASWGYRQGLIVGALSLVGFVGGAFLGGRIAPALLSKGAESPYAPLVALAGAMLIGGVVAITLEALGQRVRGRIVRGQAGGVVDGIGGAMLIAALGLALAWVFGAVALNAPGASDVRHAVQRSAILTRLNETFPPSGPLLNTLNRIDPTPAVEGPEAGVAAPDRSILRDADVEQAGSSVVKVLGTACGLGVAGSGWAIRADLVVTNAHVVAGESDTTVQRRDGGEQLPATPVHFDPRNDLALLRVEGLVVAPLRLVGEPRVGSEAAILGYPDDGPFNAAAARIGNTENVISRDAYGRGPTERRMTSLRGQVRSGNSGGPAVDARGRVATTVFASATSGPRGGFGVPNQVVRDALGNVGGPVSTQGCTR